VVLIASRDGFFNPLKPNSQDYTNLSIFVYFTETFEAIL
jgi:hypothetical protein